MTTQPNKLTAGQSYDLASLTLVGWTEGDGSGHEGYSCWDYFDGGVYRGADEHDIEPIFRDRAYEWAVANQGFAGSLSDWAVLPASERQSYEDGAAGIPTEASNG